MFMFANSALLEGGVRVRVRVREQRKIKGTTKPLMAKLAHHSELKDTPVPGSVAAFPGSHALEREH